MIPASTHLSTCLKLATSVRRKMDLQGIHAYSPACAFTGCNLLSSVCILTHTEKTVLTFSIRRSNNTLFLVHTLEIGHALDSCSRGTKIFSLHVVVSSITARVWTRVQLKWLSKISTEY